MARVKYPSDKQDQFMLRLPDGLRDRIKASADAQNRSMNAEIVARIQDSFQHAMAKHGEIPELVGKYLDSLDREKEALRETQLVAQGLVFKFLVAIQKAADGDTSQLERQIEQARQNPARWKNMIAVFSGTDEA